MNLIEAFSDIRDFRRAEGKRYPPVPMLLIVIMSIICRRSRYREIAQSAQANKDGFQKYFGLKRSRMPSHVTFRELIQKSDSEEIRHAFEQWAKAYVPTDQGDWLPVDGKAVASAVTDYNNKFSGGAACPPRPLHRLVRHSPTYF